MHTPYSLLQTRGLLVAFAALSFAFAACGGDDEGSPGVSNTTDPACAACPDTCAFGMCPNTSNGTSSNGTTGTSNGTTGTSNGTTATSNGTTGTSNGTTATSNGTTATSNGTTSTSNGTTGTSNGTTGTSNGTTGTSNGTTGTSNGTTGTSNGTTSDLECQDDDDCENDEFCDVESGLCFSECQDDGGDDDMCEIVAAAPETLEVNSPELYNGNTACPGNFDHYSINLETAQRLRVLLNQTGGDGELTLDVLGPDCETVVAESDPGAVGGRTVTTSATVGGVYTLRVSAIGTVDPANYDMTVILLAPDACTPDGFEENEGFDAATPLDSGPTPASLCEGDTDWYQIALFEGDIVNMSLVYDHGRSELMTTVYGPDGDEDIRDMLTRDGGSNTDMLAATPDGFIVTAEDAGDWFIEVERSGDGEWIDYLLDLDIVPEGELGCVERTPNETCSEATPLAPFADPRSGYLCGPEADEDWYAIRVAGGQELTVRTDFFHFEGNLELSLFAPGDLSRPVALSATAGPNFEEVVVDTVSGTYCARVFARSDLIENDYTIEASVD